MQENRIYLDGELINICYNEYALMCNYTSLREEYGDRITLKRLDEYTDDEESRKFNRKSL